MPVKKKKKRNAGISYPQFHFPKENDSVLAFTLPNIILVLRNLGSPGLDVQS